MTESGQKEQSVEPTLEPLLQAHIGKQLRNMYDAMTREPVPDRFKLLLDRLEAGEEPEKTAKAGADKAGAA
ncbi:NepR family anti-sigma factor [Rhodoblastus sp. 17X3]|uniref:NepR family anti-sigma factor n=1 Tax=Rhodoblastus sp. 17X3 TaxID=3047026 RepID=UPI0024B6FB27|nr:NepR family anti-sigma factor [Rhodoblastus sp. 17X3]MDI9848670.1 NepR family anti-sigma factor [Rhodoblastus sp. 17X3]